jgi:CRP-like cAMP-binding protein
MTLRDRERSRNGARAPGTAPPMARAPGAFLGRLVTLDAQATPLKLRPRQRITLAAAHDDLLFAVQSGVVATRAAMAGSDTGVITLYFPGDVISAGAVPCFSERTIVAATASDVLRFKSKALLRLLADDMDLLAAYDRQRDRQAARAAIHAAGLATLDGSQRLAAFLIEMALEIGVPTGNSIAIELPLTRTEIAQHLALNADTLSRMMSRLKANNLVSQKGRHHIALKNWRALADMCQLTPALIAVERNRASPLS